ncbi:hypothetical protein BCON_0431g00010 [Botryotinia convoluta]|uniref:Heterokaryon incompatibility domain-containing protein n=1 Tax=Botryotinia convoluta TaxID=54673 RepID=A0A4Z1HIV3_9HELO|nr:hypothetical protein BCON_0431g00010 [Botryotinia convoluta]
MARPEGEEIFSNNSALLCQGPRSKYFRNPLLGRLKVTSTIERFVLGKGNPPLLSANGFISQLDLAKRWLNACSETHESCKLTKEYSLPTRLIDVTSIPIRLVLTSTFTTKPCYATLSHCWGKTDFLKLLDDSLEHFMVEIPEAKLTKTFRDAIHITRSLGLPYLWIDSLCIIQSSKSDWQKEAALMCSVYSGSTINIAAAGATDGTKGCFLKPLGSGGNVQIQSTKKEIWDIGPDTFYRLVLGSPLAKRAWCLQERLLPPRTLHLAETELFWECRHCNASEYFPNSIPRVTGPFTFERNQNKTLSDSWSNIVALYSTANLTFKRDKLVAISGVAKRIQEENQDLYLAGLWLKGIEFQLLWYQDPPENRLSRDSEYRAPSWSWASVDDKGGVEYNNPESPTSSDSYKVVYYSHVIDAHVVSGGDDPFGDLVGDTLKITCSVILHGKLKGGERKGEVFDFGEVEIESLDGKKENIFVDYVNLIPIIFVYHCYRYSWSMK